MKKYIYIMMAMLAGVFVSCQKTDLGSEAATEGQQRVTINLVADDAVGTRAAATGVTQYIIEVYSDATHTTPLNIFENGTKNQATYTNGSFALILDRTVDYYCLFWADKDAAAAADKAYNTTTLKAVTLNTDKTPAEAWFGQKVLSGKEATHTITLKRAVSKLYLVETYKIMANTKIITKFKEPTVFNVADSTVKTYVDRTQTVTLTTAVNGSTTPVKIDSMFVLAPAPIQYVADKVTFKCEGTDENNKDLTNEPAFDVTSVPFQANYITNIIGHYTNLASETFTVTCDDAWATPDKDEVFPRPDHIAIGYFSGTVIETNEAGEPTTDGGYFQLGTMLGVANEDASTSGMLWSNPTNATNQTNPWTGKANTLALYKLINGETTTYPAAKVAIETNKNFSTISSVNDANYIWYLPAQKQLMAAWIVNEALTDDGTFKPFGCDLYWSATEGDTGNAWSVSFNRGNTNTYFKPSIIRVRLVRDIK